MRYQIHPQQVDTFPPDNWKPWTPQPGEGIRMTAARIAVAQNRPGLHVVSIALDSEPRHLNGSPIRVHTFHITTEPKE